VHNVNTRLQTALCVHLVQVVILYIFLVILNAMQHVLLGIMDTIIHAYNVILHVATVKIQPLIVYSVLQIIQGLSGIILVLNNVEMAIIHK
jgi:hypothetical protein